MHLVLRSALLLALVGCSESTADLDGGTGSDAIVQADTGVEIDAGVDTDTGVDADAGVGPDSGIDSVAYWELASPWTTKLRHNAEIPRIHLDLGLAKISSRGD